MKTKPTINDNLEDIMVLYNMMVVCLVAHGSIQYVHVAL